MAVTSSSYQSSGGPGVIDAFCTIDGAWTDFPARLLTPWHCGRPQVNPSPSFWSKAAPTEGCVLEKTCPEHGEVTGL